MLRFLPAAVELWATVELSGASGDRATSVSRSDSVSDPDAREPSSFTEPVSTSDDSSSVGLFIQHLQDANKRRREHLPSDGSMTVPSVRGSATGGIIEGSVLEANASGIWPTRIKSMSLYSGPHESFPMLYVAVKENQTISPGTKFGGLLSLMFMSLSFSYARSLGRSGLGIHLEFAGSFRAVSIHGCTLYGTLNGCPAM